MQKYGDAFSKSSSIYSDNFQKKYCILSLKNNFVLENHANPNEMLYYHRGLHCWRTPLGVSSLKWVNPFLHEYSCLAPPTMNNYIHKLSCWYIEQRNYILRSTECRIRYIIYLLSRRETLIRQLLQELPDLGLLCLQKH